MHEYYHTRVNPSRSQPSSDFGIFMSEMMATRQGIWDKDKGNKLKKGDYLSFITGPVGNEIVYIYLVKEELPSYMRPSHWASAKPYTENNGITSVDDRGVIVLTNEHSLPKTIEWSDVRRATGLGGDCSTWMPRGTQRVKNSERLPFQIN